MSTSPSGIDAPRSVEEGHSGPIDIVAPGSSSVEVLDTLTGKRFSVELDQDGVGRFELPADSVAGTSLIVVDANDPTIGTTILVLTPSSE